MELQEFSVLNFFLNVTNISINKIIRFFTLKLPLFTSKN